MWIIVFIMLMIVISTNRSNEKNFIGIIKRKKEGRKRVMPTELMKEFIGKVCAISLFNESFGITGKIVELENNWIKVEEKNGIRIVNGDMIRDIKIMPEKYQK